MRAQTHVLAGVAAQAEVSLLFMSPEALNGAEPRAVFRYFGAGLGRDFLISDRLDEFAHPEPARVAGRTPGGQGVVGADDFVSKSHVGFGSDEHGAVIFHVLEKVARVPGENFHMLVGEAIGFTRGFLKIGYENDLPVVAPGDRGDIRRGQYFELPLDFSG